MIPTNVYGKHDNFSLQEGHVVPCLIHKCYLAKKDDTPFVVLGSGKPLRQFIYSIDLAKLMIWAVLKYNDAEPIIFSPAEEVSIAAVAEHIAGAFQFTGKVVFDTIQHDGQYKKTVSNARLRQHLPDFTFTPLSEGLAQTVTWFSHHYENARK